MLAAHIVGSSTSYATIQAAVNAAATGATITVDAGTYAEQVTITKPLTLKGAKAGVDARGSGRPTGSASTESVITGSSSSGVRSSAFHILASDVTIDGFTVTGETDQNGTLGAGIVIGPGRSGAHIVNDVLTSNVAGLFLANASATDPALIQHCYFANNNNAGANGGRGIYTDETVSGGNLTNVTIDANTFVNNHGGGGTTGLEAACAFEGSAVGDQSNIRVTNNTFDSNGKAVLFFNTTGIVVTGNTVTNSIDRFSGALRFEGGNHNASILYNNVHYNAGAGVAVDSKGTPGGNSGFVVNDNNFARNNGAYATAIAVAANFDTYDGTFDARYNYWGSSTGPSGYGPGKGDGVIGGYVDLVNGTGWHATPGGAILFSPWATATVSANVPAAPSSLRAVAGASGQINLSWTDNAVGNETGFILQRSVSGGAYAQVGTTASGVTTFADSNGLSAGTSYSYRVLAVNGAGNSASSNVATATTVTLATTYLSDLSWTSATVGYGTIQKNASIKGNTITLRGSSYAKGIGTHAVSTITYNLGGAYGTFAADVGIDDETSGLGSVDFRVVGDGVTMYDSGVVTGTSAVGHVNVSVAGVKTLQLVATNGVAGDINYDHADWANARLTLAANTPLVSLTPTSATVGYGVLQTNGSSGGSPITLRGNAYATGLGTHASSTITYALAGRYTTFTTDVGVDDETKGHGSVRFLIQGDGVTLYDSGVVTGTSAVGHASVSVAGVKTLTLLALPGVSGSIDFDHADWANPQLRPTSSSSAVSPAPTPTARTGTVIGSAGSYNNGGTTIAKAIDGNLSTYFDGPTANGNWVGLDLSTATSVSTIRFAPRSGYSDRMVSGIFQASTTADFSTGVVNLYTIGAAPVSGSLTTITLGTPVTYRYFRYLSPANSYGDIAEFQLLG